MSVRIIDLPESDRPRERLWRRGVTALDLAAGLLAEYGGLDRLSTARAEELAARPGLGPAKAAALLAALQLARQLWRADAPVAIRRPEDLAAVAHGELSGLRRERVLVIVLDAGNRVRRVIVLSEGSVDRSLLPVREVLNAVLRNDGVAFALAHNHPSGDPTPSQQDLRATVDVQTAAHLVGLRFLDHVIVGDGETLSVR